MKYIKTYESLNEPQIGDYVICNEFTRQDFVEIEIYNFIENTIGKIIDKDNTIEYGYDEKYNYIIEYEIPDTIKSLATFDELFEINPYTEKRNIRAMMRSEIIYFSPNLELMKSILPSYKDVNKYNL